MDGKESSSSKTNIGGSFKDEVSCTVKGSFAQRREHDKGILYSYVSLLAQLPTQLKPSTRPQLHMLSATSGACRSGMGSRV